MKRQAVKFAEGADDLIEGLAVPFGGPINGKDFDGEFFSPSTDLALAWFSEIPLLYAHGRDPGVEIEVVGRVKSREMTDTGAWAKAQLDKSSKYFEAIKKLIDDGKLFFSSGAMGHLAQTNKKSGEILRWPWVELSLVVNPSNLLATVEKAKAVKHFEDAGLETAALETEPAALKADPAPPEPEPAAPAVKQVSYEERRQQIEAMLNPQSPFPEERHGYISVRETYDDHVIVCRHAYDSGEETYWSITYSLDPDTELIMLSDPVEVEQTYVPVAIRSVSDRALQASAIEATQLIKAVAGEAKALSDRRIKEGRVLSSVNRSRLEGLLTAIDGATADIRDLLAATAPADQAKAIDLEAVARREFLANTTRLRVLQLAAAANGD